MGAGRSGGGEPGEEGQDGRLRAQMMQQSLPDNVRGRAHLLAHVVREVGRPTTVRWQWRGASSTRSCSGPASEKVSTARGSEQGINDMWIDGIGLGANDRTKIEQKKRQRSRRV